MSGLEGTEGTRAEGHHTSEERSSIVSVPPNSDSTQRVALVRVFVSSPSDVKEERTITRAVFDRLQTVFAGELTLEPYLWEEQVMFLTQGFQDQIAGTPTFNVVICMLWGKLGYPVRADSPETGTQQEIRLALEAAQTNPNLHVILFWRRDVPPSTEHSNDEVSRNYAAVQKYVASITQENGIFKGGFNEYRGIKEFDQRFEQKMRSLLEGYVQKAAPATSLIPVSWKHKSPFRGLEHFELEDAPIFRGRQADVVRVVRAIKAQAEAGCAFVLVHGASGAGKSSLVRAGVAPELMSREVVPEVDVWRWGAVRPSEVSERDAFEALACALVKKHALPELLAIVGAPERIADALRAEPAGIALLVQKALSQAVYQEGLTKQRHEMPLARLILVVDQLEEIFTVERLAAQREPFLVALEHLARSGLAWILATLRSDFYARCQESPTLARMSDFSCVCRTPDKEQLTQMIRYPAAAAGLEFEIEDRQRLDDLLRDEATESEHALPLLEFALEELYQKRRGNVLCFDVYREMGGVKGALGRRAEESFKAVSPEARARFDDVFSKLVLHHPTAEKATRQRARKDEVAVHPEAIKLVDQLIKDRLLVSDRDPATGVAVVSVAHEALLDRWVFLREWIDRHSTDLRGRGAVTADMERWNNTHQLPDHLCPAGLRLIEAERLLDGNLLDTAQADYVRESLLWHALRTGEDLDRKAAALRASNPLRYSALVVIAFASDSQDVAVRAARMLAVPPADGNSKVLVDRLLDDPRREVRREAAASLAILDHAPLVRSLIARLDSQPHAAKREALAYLHAAADTLGVGHAIEQGVDDLDGSLRASVVRRAWGLRLSRGLPTLLMVLIPAIVLSSCTASVFKAFPGAMNYALAQDESGAAKAVFQGTLATFLWGGIITLFITLHGLVFANERNKKSTLRPLGTLVAGALGGLLSSTLVLGVIFFVSSKSSVIDQGWAKSADFCKELSALQCVVATDRGYVWPYLAMGVGLGIGMAMTANAVRASRDWHDFLARQSSVTGATAFPKVVELTKWMWRYGWPILVCMLIADSLAFSVLRSAEGASTIDAGTWAWRFFGGLERKPVEWKISGWGQGLSILFDSLTQGLGGFFCLVGMAFGLVASRFGVTIEARKD